MFLQPKKVKYKKHRKGKVKKIEYKTNKLKFGSVGLKARESGRITRVPSSLKLGRLPFSLCLPQMDRAPGLGHRPKGHRMPRVDGSSTGGVSQIVFGENEPDRSPRDTRRGGRCRDEVAAAHAARNMTSTVFSKEAPGTHTPVVSRIAPPGGFSTLELTYEDPRAKGRPSPRGQDTGGDRTPGGCRTPGGRRTPRTNPILGLGSESLYRTPGSGSTTPGNLSPRYDPNRSSVNGGIFGEDRGSGPVRRACHRDPNENSTAPKMGTKHFDHGHVGYCA